MERKRINTNNEITSESSVEKSLGKCIFSNNPEEFIVNNDEIADTILKSIFDYNYSIDVAFSKDYKQQVVWYNERKDKAIKFFNDIYPNTKYTTQKKIDIIFNAIKAYIRVDKDNYSSCIDENIITVAPFLMYLLCYDIVNMEMNIIDKYDTLFSSEVAYFENLCNHICEFVTMEYKYIYYGGSFAPLGITASKVQALDIRLNDLKMVYDAYKNNNSEYNPYIDDVKKRFLSMLDKREHVVTDWIGIVKQTDEYNRFTENDEKEALKRIKKEKTLLVQSFNKWLDKRITYMDNYPKISNATIRTINNFYDLIDPIEYTKTSPLLNCKGLVLHFII
ncbi:MAG: hypothetical protein IJ180_01710 [Bacteroidales bacterium]|nr:hypothetical protein [Bacteroidales bacterium]